MAEEKEQEKHIINYTSIYLLIVWFPPPPVFLFAASMMAEKFPCGRKHER